MKKSLFNFIINNSAEMPITPSLIRYIHFHLRGGIA